MKINRFSILIISLVLFACGKTAYSDIPSYRVSLTLDLMFKDKELNSVLAHKIYTEQDINKAQNEYVGFGGVLVYHSVNGFLAFDAACPYEVDRNTRIRVDESGLSATCPKCGSQYSLEAGGAPVSGPSTENPDRKRLRQYFNVTQLSDGKIYISN